MISFLKKIYRQVFLKTNFDVGLRYLPVVDYLKKTKLKDKSILEVGSSSDGLARFLPQQITGVDVFFPRKVPRNLIPIKIKGVKLPFANNSFDFIISVDTLEHINLNKRYLLISEMIRASKNCVIIVIPSGRRAQVQDKRLQILYQNTYKKPLNYLTEHLKYNLPTQTEVNTYLKKALVLHNKKGSIKYRPINNLFLRGLYMNLEITADSKFKQFLGAFFSLFLPLAKHINMLPCYRTFYLIELIS